MDIIKSMMYNIALISIISGLVDIFSSTAKFRKYINYIAAIITVLAIISPIRNLFTLIDSTDINFNFENKENEEEISIKQTLELAILNDISSYFTLPDSVFDVKIDLTKDTENILINSIILTINDSNYFRHASRIEAYLKTNYDCETEVIQNFKENK